MVKPVHSDVYQWFFPMPGREYQGHRTRRFGFLAYISVVNKGLRDVSVDSWCLHLRTVGGKWIEWKPLSIPEPRVELGKSGSIKVYPVFGQRGLSYGGDTLIRSGNDHSGFAFYVAEFYGGDDWNPLLKDGKAVGKIQVRSIFDNKASTEILFRQISLEEAQNMVEGIEKIVSH